MTADLLTRLRALTGPDSDIDAEIAMVVLGFTRRNVMEDWPDEDPIYKYYDPHTRREGNENVMVNRFTASVDAALALVERVLPGWRIENLCEWEARPLRKRGPWMCDLVGPGDFFSRLNGKCGNAPTPALALCIALFEALQAKEADHG